MNKGRPKNSKNKKNPLRVFIHNKLYENGMGHTEFMKKIGMSPVTFYKKMRTENWRVPELYVIANVLKVPRNVIFEKLENNK